MVSRSAEVGVEQARRLALAAGHSAARLALLASPFRRAALGPDAHALSPQPPPEGGYLGGERRSYQPLLDSLSSRLIRSSRPGFANAP